MIPAPLSEPNLAPLVSFKSENEVTSTAQIIILVTVTGGSLKAFYLHFRPIHSLLAQAKANYICAHLMH